jgi:hypothetical protein
VPQEVGDLLERCICRKIGDVVAAVCEATFFSSNATESGLADNDSFETRIDRDGGVLNDAPILSAPAFAESRLVPG